ncbi:hypothetical protein GCM10015536_54450 [Streptomyces griseomycini]|nr:hypothetical protein GCM10015536_54450 [Streptomyces griseomycini]
MVRVRREPGAGPDLTRRARGRDAPLLSWPPLRWRPGTLRPATGHLAFPLSRPRAFSHAHERDGTPAPFENHEELKAFTLLFAMDHQSRSTGGGRIKEPSVEVPAPTARPGAPPGRPPPTRAGPPWYDARRVSGFVSLRTAAGDSAGSSITRSVMHAYRLK